MSDKTTYTLLIYRTAPSESTPERSEVALHGHRALQAEAKEKGDLRAVARLAEVERAKTVRRTGAAHQVTDGPYPEAKEWLVGFYLLDCTSEGEAIARAQQICPLPDHAIEVRPVTWHEDA